ncbi:ADP-glyceromanno-heptose 6-epimerase [Pedosphaera parvula]|uniref:ADP-L-glycero-D-manno-heptose-6-epimerase n=1 Tax=Pedosphaera parvula (strain Ellin514) TaxID=320771 RepID=B9X9R8_PEDPL|nr:ADP-glyceromanno-heptose 6-epimerase [Pedosphaera parvula]EEF63286.1 ADP-L-glycero-D-manno-heptose-6-epimerase [Pedosphaera parvula Ellin514]
MKNLTDQRILVTGGAGFIGSALIWELNRRGCEQLVVTDFLGETEKWRNLTPLRFADYLEADDLLPRLNANTLGNFDLVLHLGACSATTERNATYLIRNNFEYTKELAAWSLAHKARFVYASSAATYGDGSAGMSDLEPDIEKFRPLNMYGYSKHLFDLYAKKHGFLNQIVGLKYFNVFGPNENHKGDMRSLVNKACAQVLQTGKIQLFKSYRPDYRDGEQKRDFLYIKDAVKMTLHLATTPAANGLFNLGSGEAHTWIELATAVFKALECEPKIEFIEMPDVLRGKYQYFTQADITKLRSAGFKERFVQLSDSVADYVKNYLVPDRKLGE